MGTDRARMGLLGRFKNFFDTSFNVLEGAPALSPEQDRGLALGAVYAAEGHLPVNAPTMEADPRTAAKLAKGPWGTTDNASAHATYRYLLDGGHQRIYALMLLHLEPCLAAHTGGGRRDLKEALTRGTRELTALAPRHGLDPKQAERWFTNSATYFGLRAKHTAGWERLPRSIAAWDAARVVHTSRIFLDAGFVRPEEAWSAIAAAVDLSRPAYRSWEEFQHAFVIGRLFWQHDAKGCDIEGLNDDSRKFQEAGKELLTRDDSPWTRLPW
ncbi:DUF1266 domain-containing protein [Streptomyces sp. NPDC048172]|uniref:DUF1266 domain-containing protein n=1 Tax=Streptomyces sp. NPDC048172 TaxID=3365505 RepID=UPI003713C3DD